MNVDSVCGRNSWYYSFLRVGGGEAWQRHMAAEERAAYGREIFEEFCLEKVDTLYKKETTRKALQKGLFVTVTDRKAYSQEPPIT